MLITPVDRIRCSLVGELRVPARVSSLSVLPSPLSGRVGVHILTFEACSSFTRVTACRVAHPPYVGFIARLRPGQFPGSGARKLPSSTNNLLGWVLPPLVICAVEAHPISPFNRLISAHFSAGLLKMAKFGDDFRQAIAEAMEETASGVISEVATEHVEDILGGVQRIEETRQVGAR